MNVLSDAVLAYELLKVGGIMIFDDYHWREYWRGLDDVRLHKHPKMAIDSFQMIYAEKMKWLSVPSRDQVFLKKIA